jgi:O-antigen ligase/tellurite resistance-related uncharacterized protein
MQKNSAIGLLFTAFLVLLGLFKIPQVFDPILTPRLLLVTVAGLGLLAVTYKRWSTQSLPWPLLLWPLLVVWGFIASQGAINQAESWYTLARMTAIAVFTAGFYVAWSSQIIRPDHVARGLILLGGVTVLWALSEMSWGPSLWQNIYDVKAGFWHKNVLSGALLLTLAGLGAYRTSLKGYWLKASIILLPALVGLLFLLRTRGAWMALAVGALAVGLSWALGKEKGPLQWKPLAWIGGVGLLTLGIGLTSQAGLESARDSSTLNNRVHFWKASVQMIQASPVTGVGPGNWKIHYPQYGLQGMDQTVLEGERLVVRPHNDYLWVATEFGLPGLLLFVGFWGLVLVLAFQQSLKAPVAERPSKRWALLGIVAYLTFSLTDFPLERPDLQVLVMILAIPILANGPGIKSVSGKTGWIWVLGGAMAFWVLQQRMGAEKRYVAVYEANAKIQPQVLLRAVPEARNAYFNMDLFGNPMPYFTGKSYSALNRLPEAETALKESLALNPWHLQSLNQLGNVYRRQGQPEKALQQYTAALKLSHGFQAANLNAVLCNLDLRDTAEAWVYFPRVKPDFQNPMYREAFLALVPRLKTYPYDLPERAAWLRTNIPDTQNNDSLAQAWVEWVEASKYRNKDQ